ncbi:thiol:disulfide interchange protein [Pasteurellaceae bacterium Pebbles2]|nr:thiol:disulfide interchange protein [Pasteurellaceae bacterium Pebbles2]
MKYLVIIFFIFTSTMAFAEENAADSTTMPTVFEDGKDYFSYSTPVNLQRLKGKVRIQSFFDYDCRHCVNVQDILALYSELNSDKVSLEEYPIATHETYYSAQVFYSLKQIKREDVADLLLFETNNPERYAELSKLENLRPWLQQNNVDLTLFDETFYSEKITKAVNSAVARTERYGVFTYPFVVLDGVYVLTISTLYNDDYTFAVLDYLVNKLTQNNDK